MRPRGPALAVVLMVTRLRHLWSGLKICAKYFARRRGAGPGRSDSVGAIVLDRLADADRETGSGSVGAAPAASRFRTAAETRARRPRTGDGWVHREGLDALARLRGWPAS